MGISRQDIIFKIYYRLLFQWIEVHSFISRHFYVFQVVLWMWITFWRIPGYFFSRTYFYFSFDFLQYFETHRQETLTEKMVRPKLISGVTPLAATRIGAGIALMDFLMLNCNYLSDFFRRADLFGDKRASTRSFVAHFFFNVISLIKILNSLFVSFAIFRIVSRHNPPFCHRLCRRQLFISSPYGGLGVYVRVRNFNCRRRRPWCL